MEGADIEGLLVVTRKLAVVSGRIVIRDVDALPPDLAAMRVVPTPKPGMRPMFGSRPATVTRDQTFELHDLFEPVVVQLPGLPRNWIVERVRYRGRDVTDTLVDFTDAREQDRLDIFVTNRVASVSGSVLDGTGAAAPGIPIMLLPADPGKWDLALTLRGAATGPDGQFRIGPVRPGEYLIVAIDPDDTPATRPDRAYCERLAAVATRLTLIENEERTVQLIVRRLR